MRTTLFSTALLSLALLAGLGTCRKEPLMANGKRGPKGEEAKGMKAPAAKAGVELKASAQGALLTLSWRNTTGALIRLATHVFAGEKHFDWVKVTLTGQAGVSRGLRFVDDRDESGRIVVDLAPGKATTETIDLAAWAKRKVNGSAPLAAGSYEASVVYDTTSEQHIWAGRLEAATRVVVP